MTQDPLSLHLVVLVDVLLTTPQLHVTFLPSDSTRQLNPLEVDLRRDRSQIAGFDQHKRVAISHLGFVALIKGSDIYIIAIK